MAFIITLKGHQSSMKALNSKQDYYTVIPIFLDVRIYHYLHDYRMNLKRYSVDQIACRAQLSTLFPTTWQAQQLKPDHNSNSSR